MTNDFRGQNLLDAHAKSSKSLCRWFAGVLQKKDGFNEETNAGSINWTRLGGIKIKILSNELELSFHGMDDAEMYWKGMKQGCKQKSSVDGEGEILNFIRVCKRVYAREIKESIY